ncbi:MAG: tryptophan--tRNA ligase, partial [Gemmatimonadota bacterium]
MKQAARVFSGMQPTGLAHLGNYLGALRAWVELQDRAECIYCIVDYHAITVPYEAGALQARIFDLAVSFLAAGLDPDRCTIFVQSDVPEHTELAWLLNTVTPLGDLERMTQFKDKASREESVAAGLLNYPVLQAADILLYRATRVPVGEDQVQHLELTREIARRWNRRFGEYFPEPEPIVGGAKRIRGLDGEAKMSKSRGNTVGMLDEPDAIREAVATAVTDPQRVRRSDPGRPEVCNVFDLHGHFTPRDRVAEIEGACRAAEIGCVECKRQLAENIVERFAPMRERAAEYRARPGRVREILGDGAARCRAIARRTMREVRERMGLGAGSRSTVAAGG